MPYDASRQASEYAKLLWPNANAESVRQGRKELWKLHSLVAAGAVADKQSQLARYSELLLKSFAATHTRKANEHNGFESLAILGTGFYNSAVHRNTHRDATGAEVDVGDGDNDDDDMFFGLGRSLKAPVAASQPTELRFSSELLAIRTLSTLISSPLALRLAFPYVGATLRRTAMLFARGRLCIFNEWRLLQGHQKVS